MPTPAMAQGWGAAGLGAAGLLDGTEVVSLKSRQAPREGPFQDAAIAASTSSTESNRSTRHPVDHPGRSGESWGASSMVLKAPDAWGNVHKDGTAKLTRLS